MKGVVPWTIFPGMTSSTSKQAQCGQQRGRKDGAPHVEKLSSEGRHRGRISQRFLPLGLLILPPVSRFCSHGVAATYLYRDG